MKALKAMATIAALMVLVTGLRANPANAEMACPPAEIMWTADPLCEITPPGYVWCRDGQAGWCDATQTCENCCSCSNGYQYPW